MKNKNLKIKYLKIVSVIVFFCFVVNPASSAMRSSSYVLYENVNHSFDGPIISNVSHNVSGVSATITWNTNVESDSFVIFDTNSGFTTSKEQGTSNKTYLSHTVALVGLDANTTYYYRLRSERINGGVTTDSTLRLFTTGTDGSVQVGEEEQQQSAGVLIIDKTDNTSPVISNISVSVIDSGSVEIKWDTDENANSFVEYGVNEKYGSVAGDWEEVTKHSVVLTQLKSSTTYHFRVLSGDSWGNLGKGEDGLFNTLEGELDESASTTEEIEEDPEVEKAILEEAAKRAMEFLNRLFPQVSLNDPGTINNIQNIEDLSNFLPAPILSGEPKITVESDKATISWRTDVDSTSQVAIATEKSYNPNANEQYQQVVGNTEDLTVNHVVNIYDLEPGTIYHYQLRSKGAFGPTAKSRDFVFVTLNEEIKIVSFLAQVKDDNTAVIKWVTNKMSDSQVKIIPYANNDLLLDQAKIFIDNGLNVIHEIEIKEFQPGFYYDVEIISKDEEGNMAREVIEKFSTQENDLPPELSHIQANSTIFLDKDNKTQTVISWASNEPTMGRIYYQEGVHGGSNDLTEKTELNENFTKEHIFVVTKFKPGTVYSFKVEGVDSGGNVTVSKVHTFMTAKKKESIIQIIIKILEDTFGWLKQIV